MAASDARFKRAKWATLATAFLSALIGLSLVLLGLFTLLSTQSNKYISNSLPIGTMVVGVLISTLSFFGCFGTIIEHRKILISYFVMMFILVAAQYVISGMAMGYSGAKLTNAIDSSWSDLYANHPYSVGQLEERYECCGLFNITDRAFPKSSRSIMACHSNPRFGYQRPCFEAIRHEVRHAEERFSVALLFIAGLQTAGLVSLAYLISKLPSSAEYSTALMEEYRRLIDGTHSQSNYNSNTPDGNAV